MGNLHTSSENLSVMQIDPGTTDLNLYRIATSLVVPRPIGWISTRSADGVDNIAPYSFFNLVSTTPPTVMFSAGTNDGARKHTPGNAIATGEFAFNLVDESLAAQMDQTSVSADSETSEFDIAGLSTEPCETIDTLRVADALATFECRVVESLEINTYSVVFGEVEYVHVDDDLLTDGTVDGEKVPAVGRLGGPFYTGVDVLDLTRQH